MWMDLMLILLAVLPLLSFGRPSWRQPEPLVCQKPETRFIALPARH